MTMTVKQLRRMLNEHRLREGWGYDRLASAMAAGGLGVMAGRTLRRFVEGETVPHESTTYRVREYLKGVQPGKVA